MQNSKNRLDGWSALFKLIYILADIFLYSYEAEFIQSLLSAGKKRLASQFNFTYRYIDDVLSINNPDFENYLGQMYPPELEIKDTTESNTSASYLDLLLSIGRDGQLHTSLYDKRDDFNFHITNFPFLSSNIPSSPAYGVFISQLIRYARACSSYDMVPTDHDIPFSRTFQGLLRYIFKDFSLFFQTSIPEKIINNGLFK